LGTTISHNTMTMNIEQIHDDITRTNFIDIEQLVPPYADEDGDEQKLNATYAALRRSIALKNRSLSLTNAYYLGKIIAQAEKNKAAKYKRKLTGHYLRMVKKTFDIFEQYPSQLLKTKFVTVQRIAILKQPQVTQLRQLLFEFFVGTQILVEENC
jgi:hypothetical protein